MDRTEHVFLRIVHQLTEIVPVVHLFKLQLFYRRSGDDHTVEFFVLHLTVRAVELIEMRQIFFLMIIRIHHDELQIHLKRCVGQHLDQLFFRDFQRRHQVDHADLQGTDILNGRPVAVHDKDVFLFQYLIRRIILGD